MKPQNKKVKRKRSWRPFLIVFLLLLIVLWITPLPKIKAHPKEGFKSQPKTVSLSWPNYGQAAIGADGYGVLDTHGTQTPVPMASITKVVTALAVLKQRPLTPGNQGGTITITPSDVASYNDYVAKGGSVIRVTQGEQLSEYQALQALMLPSANNMADTLVRWAFGSTNAYVKYANTYLGTIGLKSTTVADASGFSDQSVSTASDLTTLGLLSINNPVLRDIVSQKSAELPVAGTVNSTNWMLSSDGIVGIKTGNTDQAGGCYLFASKKNVSGEDLTLVGAIMGAPDLTTAISDSRPLIDSAANSFTKETAATAGQIVGTYATAWGDTANVLSKKTITLLTWNSRQVVTDINIDQNKVSVKNGENAGTITAVAWDKKSTGPLVVSGNLSPPSWSWRLFSRHFNG